MRPAPGERKQRSGFWTPLPLLAAGVALLLLLGTGAAWRIHHEARQAWSSQLELAGKLTKARWTRVSHLSQPEPGVFFEQLEPSFAELTRLFRAHKDRAGQEEAVLEAGRAVVEGTLPASELPEAWSLALEESAPWVAAALRASRATDAGLPPGMRAFADPRHPNQQDGMLVLQHVVRLAALQTRLMLEAGEADAALEQCLDALAFSRDLAWGGGLIGAMVSAAGFTIIDGPCADSLLAASPEARSRAIVALRKVREGMRPLSVALREEGVYFSLVRFGRTLPDDLDASPTPEVGLLIAYGLSGQVLPAFPWWHAMLERHALPRHARFVEAHVQLAAMPLSQRTAEAAQMDDLKPSWNPVLEVVPSGNHKFAARADQQRAQLDLLLALALLKEAQATNGQRPGTTLPPLYPGQAVLLPTPLTVEQGPAGLVIRPADPWLNALNEALGSSTQKLEHTLGAGAGTHRPSAAPGSSEGR